MSKHEYHYKSTPVPMDDLLMVDYIQTCGKKQALSVLEQKATKVKGMLRCKNEKREVRDLLDHMKKRSYQCHEDYLQSYLELMNVERAVKACPNEPLLRVLYGFKGNLPYVTSYIAENERMSFGDRTQRAIKEAAANHSVVSGYTGGMAVVELGPRGAEYPSSRPVKGRVDRHAPEHVHGLKARHNNRLPHLAVA